jgi:hypothetical protein
MTVDALAAGMQCQHPPPTPARKRLRAFAHLGADGHARQTDLADSAARPVADTARAEALDDVVDVG